MPSSFSFIHKSASDTKRKIAKRPPNNRQFAPICFRIFLVSAVVVGTLFVFAWCLHYIKLTSEIQACTKKAL